MLTTAAHFWAYFEICQAHVSGIAHGIAPLLREDAAQSICKAEIDEVVEAACRRPEMTDRIEALDYVRAAVCPSMCSLTAEAAVRRQGAQIQEQVLLQVENRILGEPPGEPSP